MDAARRKQFFGFQDDRFRHLELTPIRRLRGSPASALPKRSGAGTRSALDIGQRIISVSIIAAAATMNSLDEIAERMDAQDLAVARRPPAP